MTVLEKATNVAIIALCTVVATDLTYKHFVPQVYSPKTSSSPSAPPTYQIGELFAAPAALTLTPRRPSLLLVVRDGCRFCDASMPFYRSLVQMKLETKTDVKLVGVCLNAADVCDSYFKRNSVGVDVTVGVGAEPLKIAGTPTLLFVDEVGKVRSLWTGQLAATAEQEVLATLRKGLQP